MSNNMYTFSLNKEKESEDESTAEARALAIGGLVGTLGLIFCPFIVWWAWNLTVPALFGLPTIGYIQSVGLFILSRVLLK